MALYLKVQTFWLLQSGRLLLLEGIFLLLAGCEIDHVFKADTVIFKHPKK